MKRQPPSLISIDHDDYHAEHVGHTTDGRQFFLTSPFVPATGKDTGREFIALYFFDHEGKFLEAHIDDLGARAGLDPDHTRRIFTRRLKEIGPLNYGRIEVQPFQIERHATVFGLVLDPPEDDEDKWTVTVEPGNYMAFFEPWDSGEYDT